MLSLVSRASTVGGVRGGSCPPWLRKRASPRFSTLRAWKWHFPRKNAPLPRRGFKLLRCLLRLDCSRQLLVQCPMRGFAHAHPHTYYHQSISLTSLFFLPAVCAGTWREATWSCPKTWAPRERETYPKRCAQTALQPRQVSGAGGATCARGAGKQLAIHR